METKETKLIALTKIEQTILGYYMVYHSTIFAN
jgi:hypothetical protein